MSDSGEVASGIYGISLGYEFRLCRESIIPVDGSECHEIQR
jgi:hypothetical protein